MRRILMFLLLLPLAAAAPYDYTELVTEVNISSALQIQPKSSSYTISWVTAQVFFYPQDRDYQEILTQHISPAPQTSDESIYIRWDSPKEKNLEVLISSTVGTAEHRSRITKKVPWPLANIPTDIRQYTEESESIDLSSDIVNLATSLAQGHTDLFLVETAFAAWINENIDYDLSTLTAQVTQKASWVLRNRYGVCDEITNLFIALNRAIGVPARFVSGIAYTDSALFTESWGGHGWAEVYFPGYGWVPFDVTYNQLGFTDATHITFTERQDPTGAATAYRWLGDNVDITTQPLSISATVLDEQNKKKPHLTLTANPLYQSVGFGSYNLIETTVSNKEPYYVATTLTLSVPKEITITTAHKQEIALAPGEKRSVSWTIHVPENLEEGFIYTFPAAVFSSANDSSQANFTASSRDARYSFSTIAAVADTRTEEKEYAADVTFACSLDKDEYKLGERGKVSCTVRNAGNVNLDRVEVCIESQCSFNDIKINQQIAVSASADMNAVGNRTFTATLEHDAVSSVAVFSAAVLDEPKISIDQLTVPETVSFDDTYTLSFFLMQDSFAVPQDITILFNGESWDVTEFQDKKKIELILPASHLRKGTHELAVLVTYTDGEQHYQATENISMTLEPLTALQHIRYFFIRMGLLLK